ncbi:MAG: PQQ-dependent dehydrogenase, methanol/ethanol family [bacterium TMED88]|nr:PQQ-dependent dehydrogenase, methanol/ethanol family [Deltaproteobacteria bacterium]OUV32924.1 MAG: PQQ-dependent dehydrogenase, methanol/ethanol family [bacterium TMED88]
MNRSIVFFGPSRLLISAGLMLAVMGCSGHPGPAPESASDQSSEAARKVDAQRVANADATPEEWLTHGRTYREERFSPLDQIRAGNVSDLGLAWFADLPTRRGIETTPLMADGRLYVTAAWGHVLAYDARTGELLWHFDPKVPKAYARHACCDVVNRGVALWGDRVYAASLDGRLRALDRDNGQVIWEVDTRLNDHDSYTITGAPRVVNGKVIIGNGGAEMAVRGYVTAYDAQTGDEVWRFFTVPGDPSKGFEDKTQEWIASTWTGEWWKNGKGGGTAWDSFAFDPDLNLLYIGVGNAASWNRKVRSPEGGDNLFVSSIVAVDADTGAYRWHYQTTPGDHWDYTATQHMILAEIAINGGQREVIMQAPKNGFFYVLDRQTGELLSAEKYMPVTWATHVDLETGRPVEAAGVRDTDEDRPIVPGPSGSHNWHPMSFSPDTGYVYIPAKVSSGVYRDDFVTQRRKTIWTVNYEVSKMIALPDEMPFEERAATGAVLASGILIAWNPSTRQEVWRVPTGFYSGGGLLSTHGNLVFQGDLSGQFNAYAADTGETLWSYPTQGGIMGSPISYSLDGEQYVAVAQGWGGESSLPFGAISGPQGMVNISRLLVFKPGGQAKLPIVETQEETLEAHALAAASPETIENGRALYNTYCSVCHGGNAVSGGLVPDLRYRIGALAPAWRAIVIEGALVEAGMPGWAPFMSPEEADEILAYVAHEATLGHQRGEKRVVRR